MTRPRFSQGEDVILVSEDFPHMNGDAEVIMVVDGGDRYKCPHCGNCCELDETRGSYGYFITTPGDDSCCQPWAERSLRKKHDPGMDYHSLIASLNQPISA